MTPVRRSRPATGRRRDQGGQQPGVRPVRDRRRRHHARPPTARPAPTPARPRGPRPFGCNPPAVDLVRRQLQRRRLQHLLQEAGLPGVLGDGHRPGSPRRRVQRGRQRRRAHALRRSATSRSGSTPNAPTFFLFGGTSAGTPQWSAWPRSPTRSPARGSVTSTRRCTSWRSSRRRTPPTPRHHDRQQRRRRARRVRLRRGEGLGPGDGPRHSQRREPACPTWLARAERRTVRPGPRAGHRTRGGRLRPGGRGGRPTDRLAAHVRHRGVRRRQAGPGRRHRGAAPPGVPRLRLRRDRAGQPTAGSPGRKKRRQARQPREGARASRRSRPPRPASGTPAGRRTARRTTPTPTPTSATAAGSRWCTTASSRTSPSCAPRSRRPATSCARRPTPRSRPTCSRPPSPAAARSPTRCEQVCTRLEGAFTLVAVDGAGPVAGGGGTTQLAARGRDRRGRELHRLRRRGVHRAHPRGAGARAGPDRHDHPRRRLGDRLRRHARSRATRYHVDWDLSAAEKDGYDWFMRKEIFEQPRAIADALLGRHDAAGPAPARRGADLRRRAPRGRQDHHHRLRHGVLRRPGGEVRHRALDPHPVRGRARPRVPLPRPDPDPVDAGGRDQPVRRDRRHPAGDPPRAAAAVEGAGDLQHQRLDDPARVGRRHLHPRRPRDRGRLDQGLHHPDDRGVPARALPRPGPRHVVRRRDRAGGGRARRHARPRAADPRQRRPALRAGRGAPGRASRCCSSGGTSASRSRSRARSSSRSWPTSTPRASRPASSSTGRSR